MQRIPIQPRCDYAQKLEAQGLSFHAWDHYWREDACYCFSSQQIDVIEQATQELHRMCLQAVEHVIQHQRFAELHIPPTFWSAITDSFQRNDFSLYGRFDLAYDGIHSPKMLEYNADTPTSLLESAVCQWYWLEDVFPHEDQFNSVHERLVQQWARYRGQTIHFASLAEQEEDWVCITYLMDTAIQAGCFAEYIELENLGWNEFHPSKYFLDQRDQPIQHVFKLYPWEWIMREPFGIYIPQSKTQMIEPLWKSILSCKGLLAILWELYPDHPNLLPAYFTPDHLTSYAKKPLYSREGANVSLYDQGVLIAADAGPYGQEGYVYQALATIPSYEGWYPVLGTWIVGDQSAGMCIREDRSPITTNMSHFVPHYFTT
jgi:glutathionylspermidine synthase